MRDAFNRKELIIVLVILGSLAALIVPAILDAREAARAAACQGHMAQLQLALTNYEYSHGHYPSAHELGPTGEPWHSWRVKILPIIELQSVYDQYDFTEPWNGPNNRKLADTIQMSWFQCHSGGDAGRTQMTNYAVLQGPGTVFPGANTTNKHDILDGLENTILLVETIDGDIHWMEPRDVNVTPAAVPLRGLSRPSVSSSHPAGPGICFADRIAPCRLSPSVTPAILKDLSTIAGGEATKRSAVETRP